MAARKKKEEVKKLSIEKPEIKEETVQEEKPQDASEKEAVLDVTAEAVEPAKVTEITPEETPTVGEISPTDPLTDFKEKMNKEELAPEFAPEKKNFMWPILFIFIIAIVLLTGVFLYRQGTISNIVKIAAPSPTPTLVPEPTKTVDLTKYEIEVQNGSEVSGEAGRQQASLETEGFKVASIGNADNSDYADTVIKVKKEVDKDFIAKLKTFLNTTFTVGDTKTLSEDYAVPVVVIIGTKK